MSYYNNSKFVFGGAREFEIPMYYDRMIFEVAWWRRVGVVMPKQRCKIEKQYQIELFSSHKDMIWYQFLRGSG